MEASQNEQPVKSSPPLPDDGKAVVRKYNTTGAYPTNSMFQVGETVWIVPQGARGAQGPYLVVVVLGNEQYRLRDQGSNVEFDAAGTDMKNRL